MDETGFARMPHVVYGINLLLAALAYYMLQLRDLPPPGGGTRLREALGRDLKGKLSPLIYLAGILLAFVAPCARGRRVTSLVAG